ncbi:hypothetical protein CLU96_2692 [Chryseobacterium sp. 52]|uniref:DUF4870 domain-containing protein n=1 Tax=Chryseobacterium sp. 52 TaxID=2035213 RepID=UPI000C3F44CD|nr:DUF4870 domain-containing protein [Chryseobacterium sp. 52]PIF45682.1 hypothetical protein CLU96_2692 [Chryseobacterium sp. 52]
MLCRTEKLGKSVHCLNLCTSNIANNLINQIMNNKTLAIISYLIPIGWIIAYFSGKEHADALLKYHLRQSLGLMVISIVFNVIMRIIAAVIPALSFLGIAGLVILVFWVLGMINAANNAQKPVPFIGKMFEDKFAFIG